MPGHVKKTEGPDPCPDQWLMVSDELKVCLILFKAIFVRLVSMH